ncbi:MAG: alpha/beta hydrolase-fold protein [Pyrinomonadaceae bacterium]
MLPLSTVAQRTETTAAASAAPITIGHSHKLHSKVLNEDRPYLVYLPESYTDKTFAPQRYPVLYLLDGEAHFHSATGVVQFMGAGTNGNIQIPEHIVVAIPNTNRSRDLTPTHSTKGLDGKEVPAFKETGGGEKFLRFIKEELVPKIESDYRTAPHRTLVGHSFGGIFVLDAFLREPSFFNAYISMDPSVWWNDKALLKQAQRELPMMKDLRASVYISAANNPPFGKMDMKGASDAIRDLAGLFKASQSAGLRSKHEYFASEDHGSVPLLSLYNGLLFVFDGYKPRVTDFIDNPSGMKVHFKNASERFGYEILPPESLVNMLGYVLMMQLGEVDKGLEFFKINVSLYPGSWNVYDSLAAAYLKKGETKLAVENYRKSLDLNPNNNGAKEALKKLEQSEKTGPK